MHSIICFLGKSIFLQVKYFDRNWHKLENTLIIKCRWYPLSYGSTMALQPCPLRRAVAWRLSRVGGARAKVSVSRARYVECRLARVGVCELAFMRRELTFEICEVRAHMWDLGIWLGGRNCGS